MKAIATIAILLIGGNYALTQTNLPPAPASTNMGAAVHYSVRCKICRAEHSLIPKVFKVLRTKTEMGGERESIRATFTCPVMSKDFIRNFDEWIPAPIPASVIRTSPLGPPPLPVGIKKLRSPKFGYLWPAIDAKAAAMAVPATKTARLEWSFPCTNGPVSFTVEELVRFFPPSFVVLADNVQASPYPLGPIKDMGFYRVSTHRP